MSESDPVAPQLALEEYLRLSVALLDVVEALEPMLAADNGSEKHLSRVRAIERAKEALVRSREIRKLLVAPVEQASVSPPKWSEMMAEQHTCPLCDRTFTNAMELYRDEERAIDLVAKAASGGSAGGGVSSIPSDYNRAYQFMQTWLLKRNPKYANHKLTVRMRRNRLAELLCEYAAISHSVDAQGPESAPSQEVGENCYACGRTIRPTMGPGDYSCVSCGFGMVEPCEHWKASIARGEVGNSDNAASAGEPTEAGKPAENYLELINAASLQPQVAGLRTQFEEWAAESHGGYGYIGKFLTRCAPPHEEEYGYADVQMAWLAAQYFYQAGAHAPATPEGEK